MAEERCSFEAAWGVYISHSIEWPRRILESFINVEDASARQQASMLQSRDTNQYCLCVFPPLWHLEGHEGVKERIGSRRTSQICMEMVYEMNGMERHHTVPQSLPSEGR